MQRMIKEKAAMLLESGAVARVLGWKAGEFFYDLTPHAFVSSEAVEKDLVFSMFSGANLSKYLIAESKKEGKTAVFLKPCDTYSFVQLVKEHRISRENVYVVGISCDGMCDIDKIKAMCGDGILSVTENGAKLEVKTLYGAHTVAKKDVLFERCTVCKSRKLVVYDEIIGVQGEECDTDRFEQVERLEKMSSEERFRFWQGELSRCIRCNACRNVCPACSCEKCVFDNPDSGVKNTAPADSFEEKLFHIIRAFHVASRCTDCGECSRVCPQNIPLHLLNRKFIKDINEFYGTYQAGSDMQTKPPLMSYTQGDCEPSAVYKRGGKQQ